MSMYTFFCEIFPTLPRFPVPATGSLSATIDPSSDAGEDRISALPNALLSDIVSRLPITDAVHTTALSQSWARIWHSAPLLLDDSHLLRAGELYDDISSDAMAAKVSSILSSHPGPFRTIHLTCNSMGSHDQALKKWFREFADKRLQELVFVNNHFPNDVTVPADLFRCESLKQLYLGVVQLPDARSHAGGHGAFPELQEISLSHCIMREWDLEHLLACSPKLEKLALILSVYRRPSRVHVRSRSLQCMLHWASSLQELAVVSAPCLERLILWKEYGSFAGSWAWDRMKIKICSAPKLRVVGYINPSDHVLQIGETVIQKGMKASRSTMVPSVETLALTVRFGLRREGKMVPCLLKCFPCVKILHVQSIGAAQNTEGANLEFWQKVDSIECLRSSIKTVILDEFMGTESELAFLRFIVERGNELKELHIIPAEKDLRTGFFMEDVINDSLSSAKWASAHCRAQIWPGIRNAWSYNIASDLSLGDPFGYMISAMVSAS